MKSLIDELGLRHQIEGAVQTNLYVDNQSAISLIKNHDNHKRPKHIALRNNYCRQQYQNEAISVIFVQSNQQLADRLTKVNSRVLLQYKFFRFSAMALYIYISRHLSASGGVL